MGIMEKYFPGFDDMILKELRENKMLVGTLIVSTLVVGFMWYIIWETTDTSVCKRKACIVFGWGIRASLIILPVLVTIMCLRMFKEDPKDKSENPHKTYPKGYDKTNYVDLSKMGANDVQFNMFRSYPMKHLGLPVNHIVTGLIRVEDDMILGVQSR